MKKRAPIDSQIVGAQTKPYHYKVTYRDISNYSASIFDENSAYYHESKGNEIIAHPLFPVKISWQIVERLHTLWDITFPVNLLDHLIHQSEYIKIFRPIKAEEDLVVQGELIALVPHKLGVKLTIRFNYRDQNEQEVITEYVGAILLGVKCMDEGNGIAAAPEIDRVEIKEPFQQISIPVHRLASYIYDGCNDIVNPIHTNRAYAKSMGLPNIILQGTATLAMSVSAIMNKALNTNPETIEVVAGKFIGYVLPPDNLSVRFIKKVRHEYFFDVVNQKKETVIKGGYIKIK